MADHLKVHADEMFATSHAISNDAEELREELAAIARGWEDVSHGWSGNAASAYDALWQEWHEGAIKLVDVLSESSNRLGRAAVSYQNQDANSAEGLRSRPIDLEL
jgi:WXG100 family type VII secretion target